MTYKLSSEALGPITPEAFEIMVHNRIVTLAEYDAHEAVVREHAANPDMPPEDRWVTLAVPQAPAEVDAAIRRTARDDGTTEFTPDYEIVGPSCEDRRQEIMRWAAGLHSDIEDLTPETIDAWEMKPFHG